MAGIPTLLEELLEQPPGSKLVVNDIKTRNEYETIRTALSRRWAEHRNIILAIEGDDNPILSLGLCGDYHAKEESAEFYLGKSRKKQARSYSFSIVAATQEVGPDDNTQLPAAKEA